jgi:hypothetical protein
MTHYKEIKIYKSQTYTVIFIPCIIISNNWQPEMLRKNAVLNALLVLYGQGFE